MTQWMNKEDLIKWLEEGNGYGNIGQMELDRPIALKIIELPKVVPKSTKPDENKGQWFTEYKNGEEKIKLTPISSSAGSVTRFLEKYKDEDVIGRYAVFSNTTYDGKKVHSVNLVKDKTFEPIERVDVVAQLKKEPVTEEVATMNLELVEQFVKHFRTTVKEHNESNPEEKVDDSVQSCVFKYFQNYHKEEMEKIKEVYLK